MSSLKPFQGENSLAKMVSACRCRYPLLPGPPSLLPPPISSNPACALLSRPCAKESTGQIAPPCSPQAPLVCLPFGSVAPPAAQQPGAALACRAPACRGTMPRHPCSCRPLEQGQHSVSAGVPALSAAQKPTTAPALLQAAFGWAAVLVTSLSTAQRASCGCLLLSGLQAGQAAGLPRQNISALCEARQDTKTPVGSSESRTMDG